MTPTIFLGLVFTHILAPAALYLALARCVGQRTWLLLAMSFGFAPALISRLVIWLFRVFPDRSDPFYAAVVVLCFVALAVIGRNRAGDLRAFAAEAWGKFTKHRLQVGSAVLAGLLLAAALWNPTVAGWVVRRFAWTYAGFNTAGTGLLAIMPPVAALLLALFVAATVAGKRYGEPALSPTLVARTAAVALAAMLIALIVVTGATLFGGPVYENDAMQYFKVTSLFYDARSVAHYPVLPAAADGTYAATSHPLGHHGAILWGYIYAGEAVPGPGRAWVFHCYLATLATLGALLSRFGAATALAAMLALSATSAYTSQVVGGGIDPQRLMLLLLALTALACAARSGSLLLFTLAGVGAGLAMQSHQQTGLLIPLAVLAAAAVMKGHARFRVLAGVSALASAALVGGEQYLFNTLQFGTPLFKDLPIWDAVPELGYRDWRLGRAPRTDLVGRLGSGAFLGFTWWYFFGLTWWIAMLASLAHWRTIAASKQLSAFVVFVLTTLAFLVFFFGFTSSGELLVMNYRYVLTVQPLVAALCGIAFGAAFSQVGRLAIPAGIAGMMVAAFSVWQVLALLLPQLQSTIPLGLAKTQFEELDALPAQARANRFAELEAIKEVRSTTPVDAYFVVFNMNAFAYYSGRRFVRDVDPRMIPFYKASDKAEAMRALRDLGVDHVYLQKWSWPTVDNSLIGELVADTAMMRLVEEKNGYRIFALAPQELLPD